MARVQIPVTIGSPRWRRRVTVFLGHYPGAVAAKRTAARTSRETLEVQPSVSRFDVACARESSARPPVAPGDRQVSPLNDCDHSISHSLLTTCGWAVLLGGVHWMHRRYWRGAWVLALAVISHWVDFIPHRQTDC